MEHSMGQLCEFGREHVIDVSSSDWHCKFEPDDCNCRSERRITGSWNAALKFDAKFNARVEQDKCGLCGVKHRHPSNCRINRRWTSYNKYGPPCDWAYTWSYSG